MDDDWRAPESDGDDPDNYVSHHPDAGKYAVEALGDVCPECGRPLLCDEKVVVDGELGDLLDLIPHDEAGEKKAFHPECWPDRHHRVADVETPTLMDFGDEDGA